MVPENEIRAIRIKFSKTGDLMYISHLDLSRTMQRIMVRSGVDIWYSEGFNPQPRIVFAVPLPVGVESNCELMDIKINHPMQYEEIKERLQSNFPADMTVLDVYAPEVKFKNIGFIDYTIKLCSPKLSQDSCKEIQSLFKGSCVVTKKTKSGEKQINICDYIKSLDVKFDGCCVEINTALSADSENYLNPELFIDAIRQNLGVLDKESVDEYYTVLRNKFLDFDLNEFK